MTDHDPRVVADHTGFARMLIYAGIPVGLFAFAIFLTVVVSWTNAEGLCPTWLHLVLSYCD